MNEAQTRTGQVLSDEEIVISEDYEVTGETPAGGGGKTTEETKDVADAEGQVSQEREETLAEVTDDNT